MNFNGGLASLETVTGTATFQGFSVVVYGNALLEDTSGFPLSLNTVTGVTGNIIIGENPALCDPPEILDSAFWAGVSLSHCFKSSVSFDFFRLAVAYPSPSQEIACKEECVRADFCLFVYCCWSQFVRSVLSVVVRFVLHGSST